MTPVPSILITPSASPDVSQRQGGVTPASGTPSFASTMEKVLQEAEQTGYQADVQSMKALSGDANLTEVVSALSHAELTLQTVTTIRDRVVQAYQDIMKMPI